MTPVNYLAAASFVPVCLAGIPLLMSLVSYFGTSGVSRLVCRSLRRSDLRTAAGSWAPPTHRDETQQRLERGPFLLSNCR
jgi:hypothetical protein